MNNPVKPIRVMLADDHTLVRAASRAAGKAAGVEVVGEAGNGREVLNLVKLHQPEVVLMDISMPGLNGLEAAVRMAKEFPNVRVIILSMHKQRRNVWRALKAGVAGYLLKKSRRPNWKPPCNRWFAERSISAGKFPRDLSKVPLQGTADRINPLEE